MTRHKLLLASLLALALAATVAADAGIDIEPVKSLDPTEPSHPKEPKEPLPTLKPYVSPRIKNDKVYLFETFDDAQSFKQSWVKSTDARYTGQWQLNNGQLSDGASLDAATQSGAVDLQLVLPQRARHYAISSKLTSPFKFDTNKPLVVQYEVHYREGNDCGGSYVKLLRDATDLASVNDKTQYSIMFGPDKCGSEAKLHFIVQYLNPKTQQYEEKHWKSAKLVPDLMTIFGDKKHHLVRLVLKPDNSFEITLDDRSVGKGNLLDDLEPSINPPKEIVDYNDKKPDDWDERTHIVDLEAKKPDDWDDDAPRTIPDPSAVKPADWLEDEPLNIPDPEASKPEDWEDMDGDWQAPLIDNPKCAGVSGCGKWKAAEIPNPNFKGKWKAPKIPNPNYKGKWEPKLIPNPDYFYDANPFASLLPIGAVAFELWSMADDVAFDNVIVTSDIESANLLQLLTWQTKKSDPSLLVRIKQHVVDSPWLWAGVAFAIATALVLFIAYCCDFKGNKARAAERKKTDEPRADDIVEDDIARSGEEEDDDEDDDDEAGENEDESADGPGDDGADGEAEEFAESSDESS